MSGILYTTLDSVKVRLSGKVQFESPAGLEDGQLPNSLLIQLIKDAETEVEQDLRSRYAIPFQSKSKKTFVSLPDHSQRAIRVVVDFKAVEKILETDFGRGTHINAEGYSENQAKRYAEMINKLLGKDMQGDAANRFKFSPPLEDMMLASCNAKADDGFRGAIINTDDPNERNEASYAADQINHPSRSFVPNRGFGGY